MATGGALGLCELIDDKLESRKPNLLATHLDFRGDLLITCPEIACATNDGERYRGIGIEPFVTQTAGNAPDW